jgi:hypothetical protein
VIHDEAREERLALNEVLFRTVNEAIEQQAIRFGGLDGYDFICECSSITCVERVSVTLGEYERVRGSGVRFFVAPGHEDVEVELVVETATLFSTVEKDGPAGIVASLADPRDGDEEIGLAIATTVTVARVAVPAPAHATDGVRCGLLLRDPSGRVTARLLEHGPRDVAAGSTIEADGAPWRVVEVTTTGDDTVLLVCEPAEPALDAA